MNKPLLGTALATLLLGACNRPAETPVPEAPAPTADATTAAAPVATSAADTAVNAAPDDNAVDAAIDKMLGDHTKYQAVINAYQQAVAEGDKEGVAKLIDYPLAATIDGKQTSIKDATNFVQNYDKIITPAIAGVIKAQKYSELMVNGKGVMFGSGETWINGICKKGSADCSEFEVKVVTIQPGGSG